MPIDAAIRDIIRDRGYIPIDEVMRQVLSETDNSYYRHINAIGSKGDFITAPEISQLFGEMVALWVVLQWQKLGQPKNFCLLELGPGQGTLISDLLRTLKKIMPDCFKAANIYLYEINPHFIRKQKMALAGFANVTWISSLSLLPKQPMIMVANEFFDAMPIKQYMRVKNNWREAVLVVDPMDSKIKHSTISTNTELESQLMLDHKNSPDGAIIEESVDAMDIIRTLTPNIERDHGAMLLIDYGYHIAPHERKNSQYNATLQAIKNHQYVSVIDTLGEADLSAHVDFHALQKAAHEHGIFNFHLQSQRNFLINHGINLRAQLLKQNLPDEQKSVIDNQLQRLTCIKSMGELFKVCEVSNTNSPL